ncbi:MAG: amidohydrolase family protein [Candidatus Rokubacteria bacterium]|nr:amidohydrolase family protein [Candidatus Rokubacteria bacterium]
MLAIRSHRLIDGTGRPALEHAVVLVEGDSIAAVGRAQDVHIPPGAEVIDVGDETLLPGLIDAHGHLVITHEDPRSTLEQVQDPEPIKYLRAVQHVRRKLLSGITTMRVMSEHNFMDAYVRLGIERGYVPGPRLITGGKGIRTSHGHGVLGTPFDGVDAVRAAVRENLRMGAEFIKIYITNGLFQVYASQGVPHARARTIPHYMSEEEIRTAVDEAARLGRRVAAHALGGQGLNVGLRAGISTVEHGWFLDEENVELMVKHGAYLVGTVGLLAMRSKLPDPEEQRRRDENMREIRALVRECQWRAVEAGVKYVLGSDDAGIGLMGEVRMLTDFGMAPMDLIVAGTEHAAGACGWPERIGTLEPGKLADIISVRGNPLQRVEALGDVHLVMKAGQRDDTRLSVQ